MQRSFKEVVRNPLRFCEAKSHARRLDTIPVERLKSCWMKLTRVRYFSHASIILICCCISIASATSAAAAFGGFDGTSYLNDTWSFDGTTWAQIATQSAPPARTAAEMTYDSVSQKVVLFGGYDGTNYLGDTWLWDGLSIPKPTRWRRRFGDLTKSPLIALSHAG